MLRDDAWAEIAAGRERGVLGLCGTPMRGRRLRLADGRELDDFLSAAYLGIGEDAGLKRVLAEHLATASCYDYASPVFLSSPAEQAVHARLAAVTGLGWTRCYSAMTLLHADILPAVCRRDQPVYIDASSHYSLFAALRGRRLVRYPCCDVQALAEAVGAHGTGVIVSDSVFSMSGRLAPVERLAAIAERSGSLLYLDDTHGFGVLEGAECAVMDRLRSHRQRVIYAASMGKALNCPLAFVAVAAADLIERCERRALGHVFTGRPAEWVFAAADFILAGLERGRWQHLRRSLQQSCEHLRRHGEAVFPGRCSSDGWGIVAIGFASFAPFMRFCERIQLAGIACDAVGHPAIRRGTYLTRFCVSGAHTQEQIERLAAAICSAAEARP